MDSYVSAAQIQEADTAQHFKEDFHILEEEGGDLETDIISIQLRPIVGIHLVSSDCNVHVCAVII